MRMFFLRTVMVLLGIRERRIVVPQAARLAVSSTPPARFEPGNMHSRALQALLAVPDAPPRFIAHWARSAPVPSDSLPHFALMARY